MSIDRELFSKRCWSLEKNQYNFPPESVLTTMLSGTNISSTSTTSTVTTATTTISTTISFTMTTTKTTTRVVITTTSK
jgi:hypothetical protein